MKHRLYGDGIHDDTAAIQEMIDSGVCEVSLPAPASYYLISKPLELPSDFRLTLPRFAEIRLAAGSNCVMARNRMVKNHGRRLREECYEAGSRWEICSYLWSYVDDYDPDSPCRNIEICGGIWNCNNQEQLPNPERRIDLSVREFYGCGMLFYNVEGFCLRDLTVKDPSQYGITLDTVSDFTVENITFDYNDGNPYPINMDGIHLDGNCHRGMIRNLKGTCYDDLVALNAHEGSAGPITDIVIDGIYADYCHSAVRMLRVNEELRNIHISNVFGNYYQYCVALTKFYPGETEGAYDGITVDGVYAAKAEPVRKGDFTQPPKRVWNYPLIWVQDHTRVKNLAIRDVHRVERTLNQEMIRIGAGAVVDRLILENVTMENHTGAPMPMLLNLGAVRYLSARNLDSGADETIVNQGSIEKMEN